MTNYTFTGSNYDSKLSITDITSKIRAYVKEKYPKFKFSVSKKNIKYARSIDVTLIEGYRSVVDNPHKEIRKESINHYWLDDFFETHGICKEVAEMLRDVIDYTESFNYDNSDSMRDYYDTNFYVHFNIGRWDKPYTVNEKLANK